MPFIFLTLLLLLLIPVFIYADHKEQQDKDTPLHQGLSLLPPFLALFYVDDYWLVFALMTLVVLLNSLLVYLADKYQWLRLNVKQKQDLVFLIFAPAGFSMLAYFLWQFVDWGGLFSFSDTVEQPEVNTATWWWISYFSGYFIALITSVISALRRNTDAAGIIMFAMLFFMQIMPLFSASFWLFSTMSFIGYFALVGISTHIIQKYSPGSAEWVMILFYPFLFVGVLIAKWLLF